MMWEGESIQQPCEGLMNTADEQKAWGDVPGRDHTIRKRELKGAHKVQQGKVQGPAPGSGQFPVSIQVGQ